MDAIITAVVSGKGGTGKSTLAVFTGAALAALGKRVLLLELAPGLRSIDIIAGVSEQAVFDVEDVLSGRIPPAKAVVESAAYPGLSVMPAPYTGGRILPETMKQLCIRMRPHFDHVVLDVASGIGTAFKAAALVAHRFVLVETPDPVALRDGRALVDSLAGHPASMRLVLSRVNPAKVLDDGVLEDLDEAIDAVGVQLLGVVPESDAIRRAANGGQPLNTKKLEGRVFDAIARRMLGEEVPLLVQ